MLEPSLFRNNFVKTGKPLTHPMQGMGVVFSFRRSLITFELIWKKIHNIFDSGIDIDHVFLYIP